MQTVHLPRQTEGQGGASDKEWTLGVKLATEEDVINGRSNPKAPTDRQSATLFFL